MAAKVAIPDMITYYILSGDRLERRQHDDAQRGLPPGTLWIDLHHPTPEEERLLESHLQVNIPTREEMAEIEDSSRFYEDGNVLYMTTSVVGGITEHRPSTEEVTFVLSEKWLITVRYADLRSFREFENRCIRQLDANRSSTQLFALMMDSLVDRIADVLEAVQGQLSSMSREIFAESTAQTRKPKTDLQQIIKHLGRSSSLLSKLNDSLLSINRMNSYFRQGCNGWLSEPAKVLAKTVERDVRSLDEYLAKMSTEINFLLDAPLGLINIEQNSIIKVFSIAAVLFLPPTLVGTVYGMNFKDMPELDWSIGYPMALGMMVVSAILPYLWFKFKNWL